MIHIIGAGAIGQALAVMLHHAGKEVMLIRRTPARSLPITVQLPAENLEANILVGTLADIGHGPVLITAKSFANAAIAVKLRDVKAPVVLLQNGLGIEAPFTNPSLYRCVLLVTSQFDGEGVVRFKPVSACPVGTIRGKQLDELIKTLNNPWFRFEAVSDIQPLVWKKAIVNCVFNSVCPLLETDNGIFHRNAPALAIARRVINECAAVAAAQRIALTIQEIEDSLLHISRLSDGQYISTLQDIRAGRPTEIDTLNAEIVRLAGKLPVSETRLLGELTAIKSKLNLTT